MKCTALPISLGLLLLSATATAQPAAGAKPIFLHLEGQPLRDALYRWGKKADVMVGYDSNLNLEEMRARRVVGWYYPDEALGKLLAGTGLRAEWRLATFINITSAGDSPGSDTKPPDPLAEVQITGTHLRDVPIKPQISYPRSDIERSGKFGADGFAHTLVSNFPRINPQTTVGNGSNLVTANNLPHGEAWELFGWGAGSTLVLVDGQRMPLSGHDGSFADISMLTLSAIDRVEIVTDTASAIYGGDAIAGVVNYVLLRKFEGFETTSHYGFTSDGGGRELGLSQLAGHVWSDGDILVSYENYHQQAVNAASRDNLVPLSLPYELIPRQSRQSAVLTAQQKLASWIDFSVMGYYSSRNFSQDYTTAPTFETLSAGNTRTFGSTITGNIHFAEDWKGSVLVGFSGEKEKGATTVSGHDQAFNSHSNSYSLDLRSEGPVFALPAGPIRLSMGLSWRLETFNDLISRLGPTGSGLERIVLGVCGEGFIPLISDRANLPLLRQLAFSFAVRWDEYENRDSGLLNARAVSPKMTLLWSPAADFTFRGTYTPSAFRVAPLAQIGGLNPALLIPFSNVVPGAAPIPTLYLSGGNSSLRPEYATTYTVGLDWKPESWPGWSFSGTYLHIHYRDRISVPPVAGPITGAFSQLGTLAPYANLSPTGADIQSVYDRYGVKDPTGIGPGAVGATFDGRYQNIDVLNASGIETTVIGKLPMPYGNLNLRLDSQYLTQLSNQVTPTAAYVSVVRTVFNPPDVRLRSELWWSFNNWTAGLTSDFTGSFRDNAAPNNPHVSSWLIFGTRFSYEISESSDRSPERKTVVSLNVENLTNRDPPHLATDLDRPLNYDPSNSSPLGRQFSIEVRQRW